MLDNNQIRYVKNNIYNSHKCEEPLVLLYG